MYRKVCRKVCRKVNLKKETFRHRLVFDHELPDLSRLAVWDAVLRVDSRIAMSDVDAVQHRVVAGQSFQTGFIKIPSNTYGKHTHIFSSQTCYHSFHLNIIYIVSITHHHHYIQRRLFLGFRTSFMSRCIFRILVKFSFFATDCW